MISKDFFQALEDFERERRIKKEVFINALETALTSAYKKNYGEAKSAIVKLNPDKNTIKIYSYKTVVETVEDEDKEISLEDAQQIKKSYKLGDSVEQEETPKDFGRIAAQTAKQVVMQKLREAEKELTISEMAEKEGELITAIVRRIDGKNVFVEIGSNQTEAILSENDQIPGEKYMLNSRIKVYLKKIKDGQRGPLLQVTRSNTGFVKRLFELEVPEIENGLIEIKSIAREAGYRTKIALSCAGNNIDVIGACVGNKGMRINSIVNELNGEKIDIIEYSDDVETYISRALSPAKVVEVTSLEDGGFRAIVPDDKLSLAIGKDGQNVRLAAKLTKCKIDVKSESSARDLKEIKSKTVVHLDDDLELDENITDLDDMFNVDF